MCSRWKETEKYYFLLTKYVANLLGHSIVFLANSKYSLSYIE